MSSDLARFEVAGGSATGRAHVLAGRNNQDAFAWSRSAAGLTAVVADGCSGGAHSELGAQLGARALVALLQRRLNRGEDPGAPDFWPQARAELLDQLRGWAARLGEDPARIVSESFLFTLLALVVTPQTTWVLALGDGVVAINDQVHRLGPFPGNAPPYLGYALLPGGPELGAGALLPRLSLPTAELEHALLGTDGACDLGLESEALLPFWEDDRCFQNPDLVRRRLVLRTRPLPAGGPLPLQDDTTLVVIRRGRGGEA